MKKIFLYGAPASGKSTLAKLLARQTGRKAVDLDAAIVERDGRQIPQIFAEDGEPFFRDLEAAVLADAISSSPEGTVIALGGGTLLRERSRALCEANGAVLCLEAPDEAELARRIGAAAGSRPLGDKARERAPHYASFPSRIAASFDLDSSAVIVGSGIAGAFLDGMKFAADATVAGLYGKFGEPAAIVPSGEEFKTPATVASLWSAFAKAGLGRRDYIAALGGGVTGDLTGFAAATWMRGMDWINFPTTLLSMVDASTGGKTGCDLPEGKNLAGAFHSPRLVVIDTDFLKTLPPEILAAGRAEMIKHEAIGCLPPSAPGGDLPAAAEIAANLSVKIAIVRDDPFEKTGRRMLLNCGHTIGHAVEKASGYSLSHGEAVAIGCVEEARLAVSCGLAPAGWPDEFAARFKAAGLPVSMPDGMTLDSLLPVMRGDKKRAGSSVDFALPCGWGDVRIVRFDLSSGVRKCD